MQSYRNIIQIAEQCNKYSKSIKYRMFLNKRKILGDDFLSKIKRKLRENYIPPCGVTLLQKWG